MSNLRMLYILWLFYKLGEMVGEASLSNISLTSHSDIDQRRGWKKKITTNGEGF